MYKVTAYFKTHKVSQMFKDVYDAIDYKDSADAHYPKKVTFEKGVFSMREWVYDCWNSVMDDERNPLSSIPDFSTRHMIMQVLAWMWCIVFGIIVGSMYAGVFSMVLHTLLLGAIAVTVATFETAKRKPSAFSFIKGYHSHGRSRGFTIWRDEKGNAKKVPLDPNDPGGEHE
jgi:tetrahydromethanopterin S-methyltransferase subunit B